MDDKSAWIEQVQPETQPFIYFAGNPLHGLAG